LGCNPRSGTEKYQRKRNKIVNVQDRVKMVIQDAIVPASTSLYLIDNYLLVTNWMSKDYLIQVFDRNSFDYVTSTGHFGPGPGEIANIGYIGIDESNRVFFVSDHAKQLVYKFYLDSVLANPDYLPEVKMKMSMISFPDSYKYINDTLSFARIIEPIGNNDFSEIFAKWNMRTGEITSINYDNPKTKKKKRATYAVSVEHGIYVQCYYKYDLMTICDLEGNLKYNIYGPNWGSDIPTQHYSQVIFSKNHILARYSGASWFASRVFPTGILVVDLTGNYLKTLETGYRISEICYDEKNNRLILFLDEEFQFAYLDMSGLLD